MAYRKILVPLTGGERDGPVLSAAFEIATAFGGHVAGVYVRPDPSEVLPYLGEGVSAGVMQEIMDVTRAASSRAAGAARERLGLAAQAAGVSLQEKAQAGAGASFQAREGVVDEVVAQEARLSDLVVFDAPASAKEASLRSVMEAVLVNGRKPLLLAPRTPSPIIGAKIAIGWDGGAAAAQAISAAIPLLERASAIEILNVTTGPIDTVQMDRLRDYLAVYGLAATEHGINPGSDGVARALLDGAMGSGAGLLVVGGYGHSRLRELVLGGVTRDVFANAPLPVFMAH